ncbi:reverse transcriptase [Tanacetum coccineum]
MLFTMVGTRNIAIEPQVDEIVRNWVTSQVNNSVTSLTDKIDSLTNVINEMVVIQHFLVNDVDCLKSVEGSNRFNRMSKLDFLKFNGDDVKGWMTVYEKAILKRFGEVNEDPMVELKNLSMYIASLPPTIEINASMFRPRTLADAFSLYNFQETALALTEKRYTPLLPTPKNTYENVIASYPTKHTTTTLAFPNTQTMIKYPTNTNLPNKWLTRKEITKKRAKGLCFYYNQKYMPDHKYSGQMFVLEFSPGEGEQMEGITDSDVVEEVENSNDSLEMLLSECYASPQISLNAISGAPTFNTMRMKAVVAKHLLHLLMDTGSTHNFLDLFTTKKLGSKITKIYPLKVIMAGGNKMVSLYKVYGFQWSIQGYQLKTDVMLLPLGGCEMVLGIQWWPTLRNI